MPKYFLFTDGVETHVTQSRMGYDGWQLVGRASRSPRDDEAWDPTSKEWKTHKERRGERQRHSMAHDPHHLLNRIEALEARVAELTEGKTNG